MAIIYTIEWLERKKTTTGKDVISASLKTPEGVIHDKVSIWSNFPNWINLTPGGSVSGEIVTSDKGYKSLKEEMTKGFTQSGYRAPSGAVKAAEITRESVKEAQGKKNESIAFFSSTNAAIELVKSMPMYRESDAGDLRQSIITWRNFFLDEWKKYEAQDPNDKRTPF